jgi:hypothetical protein
MRYIASFSGMPGNPAPVRNLMADWKEPLQISLGRLMRLERAADGTPTAGGLRWLLVLAAMAISAVFALRLGQDASWDVLNYHYYSGFAFLHKPFHYDFAPAQVQTFFNPLLHVLSYLLLAHLPAVVTGGILGAIQGLNLYLIYAISEILFRRWPGPYRHILSVSCAAAGFYGTVTIIELGTTFDDNMASILILAGVLLLLRYLLIDRKPNSLLPLFCAGAFIGVAFGLKLTTGIYAIAIALAFPIGMAAMWRDRLRRTAVLYAGLALGFAAVYGVWGWQLYREYQNPFFPYLNNIFRSPFYDLENTMDPRFLPQTWQQVLFYPFYFAKKNQLVCEMQFRDFRLAFCYVALLLLAGSWIHSRFRRIGTVSAGGTSQKRDRCLLFLGTMFPISYVLWEHISSIYRYIIVLEMLAPAFLVLVLVHCMGRRPLTFGIALLLNLIVCKSVIPTDLGRRPFSDDFLEVELPPIPDLDRSVVLMVGEEATSYMIPSFPASTRFLRVTSNFLFPGRNSRLDERIRTFLAQYDDAHTFVLLASPEETGQAHLDTFYYGKRMNDRSCLEIGCPGGVCGSLCRLSTIREPGERVPSPAGARVPILKQLAHVRLEVTPADAVAGQDTLVYQVIGLKASAVDMLYTLEGELMPPVRNWSLDAQQRMRVPIGAASRKGEYHIIGIRDSHDSESNEWIAVDAKVRIR